MFGLGNIFAPKKVDPEVAAKKAEAKAAKDGAAAKKAAAEIVGTHLHLLGKDQETFVNENFPAAWKRYDVNEEGKIELDRMPIFLRHICGNTEACIGM